MLEYMKIKNFQSHKDTYIEFSPGMTSITGDNHAGKTSIIRALYTLAFNPRGLLKKYKRHHKHWPRIEIGWNGHVIVRDRSGYSLDGEEFKALDGIVPKDIQNVLNLSSINFKLIREGLFLISSSPGERARLINKATGIQEQEHLVVFCSNKVREKTSEIEKMEHSKANFIALISKLSPVLSLQDDFNQLEEDEEYLAALETDLNEAQIAISNLAAAERSLGIKTLFGKLASANAEIRALDTKIEKLGKRMGVIQNTIAELSTAEQTLSRSSLVNTLRLAVNATKSVVEETAEAWHFMQGASKTVGSLASLDSKLKVLAAQYTEARENLQGILKSLKICPTCLQKVRET